MNKREVYLDHASTTALAPKVLESMLPYFSKQFGNPESTHSQGLESKVAVDKSRLTMSKILNCSPSEIVFTSGGTESDNLAIFGVSNSNREKGKHIISTKTEHSAVLEPLQELEKNGFEVTYLDIDQNGLIDLNQLKESIRTDTILISIIYANNEIGVIQDIEKIGKICQEKNVYFHSDACQAAGYLSLDVKKLNTDLLTINASKIYGPKGIGALYIKKGTKISPTIFGGGQESGIRSGTLNVPSIVGFAKALELIEKNKDSESEKQIKLRDKFIHSLLQKIPGSKINGTLSNRLPNNINLQLPGKNSKELVLILDHFGIQCSTGSACSSKKEKPSHVLIALGLSEEEANSCIRLSIGKNTVEKDIDYCLSVFGNITKKLS